MLELIFFSFSYIVFLCYRVPELLFQPSMIGIEQAGIVETIDYVLKKYDATHQDRLTKVSHLVMAGG